MREAITLHRTAAAGEQEGALLVGLDAFGDDADLETGGEADDGFDDRRVVGVAGMSRMKLRST